MRKIIFTRPDGGVSVVSPARNVNESHMSDDEIEQRAWSLLPTDAISPQFVSADAIPTDRTFRNAWKVIGASIGHDMPKAREIHLSRLRTMRVPKLAALDVAYMRADEAGDAQEKARISAQKRALRDVTSDPRIEAAQTPEELKAVIPDALR